MSAEDSKRRRHIRTPVALLVQYRLNAFEEFLTEYAVDLSASGMFVHTRQPAALGSMLEVQFSLKDGSKLIEGIGKVVRVVPPGAPGQTPGMGVEFVQFDEESSALIRRICGDSASLRRPRR
jgi:uncharacterized protein (TIGR02266 family)